jgi:hypothetical protein
VDTLFYLRAKGDQRFILETAAHPLHGCRGRKRANAGAAVDLEVTTDRATSALAQASVYALDVGRTAYDSLASRLAARFAERESARTNRRSTAGDASAPAL